jgi:hypothetical protein
MMGMPALGIKTSPTRASIPAVKLVHLSEGKVEVVWLQPEHCPASASPPWPKPSKLGFSISLK